MWQSRSADCQFILGFVSRDLAGKLHSVQNRGIMPGLRFARLDVPRPLKMYETLSDTTVVVLGHSVVLESAEKKN